MLTLAGKQVDVLNTFTNHTYDDVLGIYHAQARFYDPKNQHFTSADPYFQLPFNIFNDGILSISQFNNKYSYALNNPLLHTDPTGRAIPFDSPRPTPPRQLPTERATVPLSPQEQLNNGNPYNLVDMENWIDDMVKYLNRDNPIV